MIALMAICTASAEEVPANLIERLRDDEFRTRVQAEADLRDWAAGNADARAPVLLGQARHARDPEVRQRSYNVLRELAMADYQRDGEGYLGINMNPVRVEVPGDDGGVRHGIAIFRVIRDTPARDAGLRVGDAIISINGQDFDQNDPLTSFQDAIRGMKPGEVANLAVVRQRELVEISVTLARRPPVPERLFFDDIHEVDRQARAEFFRQWLENLENRG